MRAVPLITILADTQPRAAKTGAVDRCPGLSHGHRPVRITLGAHKEYDVLRDEDHEELSACRITFSIRAAPKPDR